jgi:hypothetical protein
MNALKQDEAMLFPARAILPDCDTARCHSNQGHA